MRPQRPFIEGEVVLLTMETLRHLYPDYDEYGEYARLGYLVENAMPDAESVEVLVEGYNEPIMIEPRFIKRMKGCYLD